MEVLTTSGLRLVGPLRAANRLLFNGVSAMTFSAVVASGDAYYKS